MTQEQTAEAIRMAMAKKGIKGKDLASMLGVAPLTLSRWRDAGCNSMRDLTKIAEICDMSFEEMMELGK